ncbi:helix-turn-helix domain-containing protein [bacterium]|nr:helix-turn-helix domain-containing protein [bacterium]
MRINEEIKLQFKKLGIHIKEIRESKKVTISELSKKTCIRKEYLLKIEQGNAYGVQIEKHLVKIAKGLNITLSQLFDYE